MRKSRGDKLNEFVSGIKDTRRMQGRRHSLTFVVKIIIAARAANETTYVGMSEWAKALPQAALRRMGGRKNSDGFYSAPSEPTIRRVAQTLDADDLARRSNEYFLVMSRRSLAAQRAT